MSNILNHNNSNFNIKLITNDYWDHYLYTSQNNLDIKKHGIIKDNLSVYIDTTQDECIDGDELLSKNGYVWEYGVNNGVVLNNIGLTGVDTNHIQYNKNKITSNEFLELYTNSQMVIPKNDIRLHINKINGNNKIYSYFNEYVIEDGIKVSKLQGGFYQGFFNLNNGCDYQVLPLTIKNGWTLEFTLKPKNFKSDYIINKEKYSNDDYNDDGWDGKYFVDNYANDYYEDGYSTNNHLPTLNDMYPNNKGIFFYIGTRSENKWWKYYTNPKLSSDLSTDNGINIDTQIELLKTDNKFITYNQTPDGLKSQMGDIDTQKILKMEKQLSTDNYFIHMHHAKNGYTVRNIKELQQKSNSKYNILNDLYRNALAFQIKEDGSIGYKYLVKNCQKENGYEIKSEWSLPNMVEYNKWNMISVRIIPHGDYSSNNYDVVNDTMRLLFYVNGKLVLYSQELPMLMLRKLNDIDMKQETIPYNISIGGGTQGLCDVVYENYNVLPEYVLYIEKEFGGSFTGFFKSFKFYTANNNYNNINSNYYYEKELLKNSL